MNLAHRLGVDRNLRVVLIAVDATIHDSQSARRLLARAIVFDHMSLPAAPEVVTMKLGWNVSGFGHTHGNLATSSDRAIEHPPEILLYGSHVRSAD